MMIRRQIQARTKSWLETVYAEWEGHEGTECVNPANCRHALKHAATKSHDELADYVWEKAKRSATCEKGGWEVWACPFGCVGHRLPVEWPH